MDIISKSIMQGVHYDLDVFLRKYPDPTKVFRDEQHRTDEYLKTMKAFLKNEFPFIRGGIIKEVMLQSGYKVLPALHKLRAYDNGGPETTALFREVMRPSQQVSASNAWGFVHERFFVENYAAIMAKVEERKTKKAYCPGCHQEVLEAEMVVCTKNHKTCVSCMRVKLEQAANAGTRWIPCSTQTYPHTYDVRVLFQVGPPETVEKALGMSACPFCQATMSVVDSQRMLQCFWCHKMSCIRCKTEITWKHLEEMAMTLMTGCWRCLPE